MNKASSGFVGNAATAWGKVTLVLGLTLAAVVPVYAQVVLPPVVVTAPATGGGTVLCTGDGCANLLASMQATAYFELHDHEPPIGEPNDAPIDREEFCSNLSDEEPDDCGSTPPPAPMVNTTLGVYATQYGNGCGDGGWAASIADFIAGPFIDDYSGNPNEPMPGIHFLGSCNDHDACYAGQGNRGSCDNALYTGLSGVCGAQTGEVRDICLGFAHAYSAAVSLGGQGAYNAAGLSYQCALWHKNMENNGCDQ